MSLQLAGEGLGSLLQVSAFGQIAREGRGFPMEGDGSLWTANAIVLGAVEVVFMTLPSLWRGRRYVGLVMRHSTFGAM